MNAIATGMLRVVAAALMGLAAASAQASLTERDFTTGGDGLLIFDSLANREWVDVTHTTNMSVNQFFNTSMYAGQGFHLATTADITQFFVNAGAAVVTANGGANFQAGNLAAAQLLNALMEHQAPYTYTGGNQWVHGFEDYGNAGNLTVARFIVSGATATFDTGTNGTAWTRDSVHAAVGIFAYRDTAAAAIPEPTSIALVAVALLGLAGSGRQRSQQQ